MNILKRGVIFYYAVRYFLLSYSHIVATGTPR